MLLRATHNLYVLVNKYLGKKVERGDTSVPTLAQLDKARALVLTTQVCCDTAVSFRFKSAFKTSPKSHPKFKDSERHRRRTGRHPVYHKRALTNQSRKLFQKKEC